MHLLYDVDLDVAISFAERPVAFHKKDQGCLLLVMWMLWNGTHRGRNWGDDESVPPSVVTVSFVPVIKKVIEG